MMNSEYFALFHDAELRSAAHDPKTDSLELGFEKANGEFCKIKFFGNLAFRIVEMRSQNVVSRLLMHGCNLRLDKAQLGEYVSWIFTSGENEKLEKQTKIDNFVAQIESGTLKLFVLEPSWGAEIAVISNEIGA